MKIKFVFTISFIYYSLHIGNILLAQEWENNILTKYFFQKQIVDIGNSNNKLFILCKDGLYFYDKKTTEKYQIDVNSLGSLRKYKVDNPNFVNLYENVYAIENSIWLTEKYLPYITKIQDDSVSRINLPRENDSVKNFTYNNFCLDESGKLWVVRSKDFFQFNSKTFQEKNKLYELEDTIEEIHIPISISDKYIFDFLISYGEKYFLYLDGEKLKLTKVQNDNVEELTIDSNNTALEYSCKLFENTFYIVGNNGLIYMLDNIEIKKQKIDSDINFDFNLEIYNSNLFIPTFKGLLIYDPNINKTYISSPIDFNNNCYYGFNKVYKYFNYIVAVYGGTFKINCKSNSYGLAAYNLN